mgnify:CR=1 FL=1
MVIVRGFIPCLCFKVYATYEPSLPPLTGTTQSKLSVFDLYLSRRFSSSFSRFDQSNVFFSYDHWHALHHPLSSNSILGLVDIFKQFLHQNIFLLILIASLFFYHAVHPPSTTMFCPVTYVDKSLARYAIIPFKSSSVAILLNGVLAS